ncbi:MAG: SBBP repeat-containing protein [Bacteroidia bacterium]|nr:SBBP repeat-containing protein [Bacteroidia bacterium]
MKKLLLFVSGLVAVNLFFGRYPSGYILNKGQWNKNVLFLFPGKEMNVWIMQNGIMMDCFLWNEEVYDKIIDQPKHFLYKKKFLKGHAVKMTYTDCSYSRKPGNIKYSETFLHYFINNTQITDVPVVEEFILRNVWENIDIKFYIENNKPRYDFILHPGADIEKIKFDIEGVSSIEANSDNLILKTTLGNVFHGGLKGIQGNKKVNITWSLKDGKVGFNCDYYKKTEDLIIDPLIYSTFIGGTNIENCFNMVVNAGGEAYVVGSSVSSNFPTTPGAYSTTYTAGEDIVVSKLNAAGTNLIFSTFIGGNNIDIGYDIELDNAGNIYLVGRTTSTNFPVTAGSFDNSYNSGGDAVVLKLSPSGNSLLFSTYLGGNDEERAYGIKLASNNNIYITGYTNSSNYPTTAGVFDQSYNGSPGNSEIFVACFDNSGSSLLYSTFVGGTGNDIGRSINIDSNGNINICGDSFSANFPVTAGCVDPGHNGNRDIVVFKLNSTLSNLLSSTYLGTNGTEYGFNISVNNLGEIFLSGITNSNSFSVTPGALNGTYLGGANDVVFVKLNANLTSLLYSTFLGGNGDDQCFKLWQANSGTFLLSGYTSSTNLPVTATAIQTNYGGGNCDAYILLFDQSSNAIIYCSYLGHNSDDFGRAAIIDAAGDIYISGHTQSANFPTVNGSFDISHNGVSDLFVSKISTLIPLNIKFHSITGKCFNNNTVYLDIKWFSGHASYLMEILNSHDGINWYAVYSKKFESSNEENHLQLVNVLNNPAEINMVYYMAKIIKPTGLEINSEVIKVNLCPDHGLSGYIFPNPIINENCYIHFGEYEKLFLTDIQGRVLKEISGEKYKIIPYKFDDLKNGTYIVYDPEKKHKQILIINKQN